MDTAPGAPCLLDVGTLVEIDDTGGAWRGLVRGVSISDGTAQVTLLGGAGEVRALNSAKLAKGARCFVRGDSIIGSASALPYEEGEI